MLVQYNIIMAYVHQKMKSHLVSFVFIIFSTGAGFQMSRQIACLKLCFITLVAFFLLLSTVDFQMGPQMVCMRRCIVTLVAFV